MYIIIIIIIIFTCEVGIMHYMCFAGESEIYG